MLTVLSPAKSLNLDPAPEGLPHSSPALLDQTSKLVVTCRRQSTKKLMALMRISEKLAVLNRERFAAWTEEHTPLNAKQAALMFAGDTYRGLDAGSMSEDDLVWAQDHVALLSGFYGVLRPLDLAKPYRLEMGSRLKTRRGTNLYSFWKDRITKRLQDQLADHPDPTIVNCASNEYFSALQRPKLQVLDVDFREVRGDGRLQTISFFAKRARGSMARFLVQNRVDTVEGVKDFD
ncbi:MAG: peroxide stress protein YaaA, partial [Deltaproteobacteria bacterium]|nr:peroxide stress protein YaaA [Deltaproteobacteria bacterium]